MWDEVHPPSHHVHIQNPGIKVKTGPFSPLIMGYIAFVNPVFIYTVQVRWNSDGLIGVLNLSFSCLSLLALLRVAVFGIISP